MLLPVLLLLTLMIMLMLMLLLLNTSRRYDADAHAFRSTYISSASSCVPRLLSTGYLSIAVLRGFAHGCRFSCWAGSDACLVAGVICVA